MVTFKFLLAFISKLCVWSVAASLLPGACLVLLGKLFSLYFIWLFPLLPPGSHLLSHKYDYVHFTVQYIYKFWQNDQWICSTLLLCFLFIGFYMYVIWLVRVYIFLCPTYFHMMCSFGLLCCVKPINSTDLIYTMVENWNCAHFYILAIVICPI